MKYEVLWNILLKHPSSQCVVNLNRRWPTDEHWQHRLICDCLVNRTLTSYSQTSCKSTREFADASCFRTASCIWLPCLPASTGVHRVLSDKHIPVVHNICGKVNFEGFYVMAWGGSEHHGDIIATADRTSVAEVQRDTCLCVSVYCWNIEMTSKQGYSILFFYILILFSISFCNCVPPAYALVQLT